MLITISLVKIYRRIEYAHCIFFKLCTLINTKLIKNFCFTAKGNANSQTVPRDVQNPNAPIQGSEGADFTDDR